MKDENTISSGATISTKTKSKRVKGNLIISRITKTITKIKVPKSRPRKGRKLKRR